ncbi:MAG: 50S ribosomal protein L13 [Planctomycetota bacterium]
MDRFAIQKTFMERDTGVQRRWFHVDAEKEILGRMATRVARILMGKHKPTYTPHVDCGDFVVVTNASRVGVTGRKREKKLYHYHTGYMGGLRTHNLDWMLAKRPEDVVRLAVRRMLPKNKLGRKMLRKLKVYPGPEHRNRAQNPETIGWGAEPRP